MRVTVHVEDEDEAVVLRDLFRWLLIDEEAPQDVRLTPRSQPGSMGALEVIDVALTHSVGIGSLAVAYAAWRRARRNDGTALTFTRASDGLSVTVENGSQETVGQLIAAFSEPVATPEGDPTPPEGQ